MPLSHVETQVCRRSGISIFANGVNIIEWVAHGKPVDVECVLRTGSPGRKLLVMVFSSLDHSVGIETRGGECYILEGSGGHLMLEAKQDLEIRAIELKGDQGSQFSTSSDFPRVAPDAARNSRRNLHKSGFHPMIGSEPQLMQGIANVYYGQQNKATIPTSGPEKGNWQLADAGTLFAYTILLKFIVAHLICKPISVSQIFHIIRKLNLFSSILSSHFTILKKLLVKFNRDFIWHQEGKSSVTRVASIDAVCFPLSKRSSYCRSN